MSNVVSAKKDYEKLVEARYIPLKSNYKGYPIPVSVVAEGKQYKHTFLPRQWAKVPMCLANVLKEQVKKQSKRRFVPDGTNLERNMEIGRSSHSDGQFNYDLVEECEPDYEVEIKGDIG